MKRERITTKDGSHTISIPEWNVTYHSLHGAVQESKHVFIEAGLRHAWNRGGNEELRILEMGLGTGLNAFLTAIDAEEKGKVVHYTTLEKFPLSPDEAGGLNYAAHMGRQELFSAVHACAWNEMVALSPFFSLQKIQEDLLHFRTTAPFHLVYYDAFAPSAQPELWTAEVFEKLFDMLLPGGLLLTYCSKSIVRRAMAAAGFSVSKLPGPPGKREMVRAERKGSDFGF